MAFTQGANEVAVGMAVGEIGFNVTDVELGVSTVGIEVGRVPFSVAGVKLSVGFCEFIQVANGDAIRKATLPWQKA